MTVEFRYYFVRVGRAYEVVGPISLECWKKNLESLGGAPPAGSHGDANHWQALDGLAVEVRSSTRD
jgi:hypothetical protein